MHKRIVVLRAGGLGDVLLTVPALYVLRDRFPHQGIEAIGYEQSWAAVGALVDEVTSIDLPLFAPLFTGAHSSDLERWFERVDLLVSWTSRVPQVPLTPVIHDSPYPPPGVHAAAWLVRSLGEEIERPHLSDALVQVSPDERARGRQILDNLAVGRPVVVHPGAGAGWKRWSLEGFAHVADSLSRDGHSVVLAEGPADAEITAAVRSLARSNLPTLRVGSTRILAAILAESSAFVGNDSGVTHLAAMAGVPTVALFGPSDPASWAPLGSVHVLRACTARAHVQGQIRVCHDPHCMEHIQVADVLLALKTQDTHVLQDSIGSLSGT
ncbi:MAG: glycosyltransferase family 9 protein [Chloroflexota bacterium]|nr:MAG: hypothetical protein DLM70_15540 [Chloroflexota bacterium]